jgi:hypothetical protein
VPASELLPIKGLARKCSFPFDIFHAGRVEAGEKQVVIAPKGDLVLDDLAIR